MNSVHIENMANNVIQHLKLPPSKLDLVREAIQAEWIGRVAFTWSRADVARICQAQGWAYPDADECDTVLFGLMADASPRGVTEDDVITQLKEHQLDRPDEEDESENTEDSAAPATPAKPRRRPAAKTKAKRKPAKARKRR